MVLFQFEGKTIKNRQIPKKFWHLFFETFKNESNFLDGAHISPPFCSEVWLEFLFLSKMNRFLRWQKPHQNEERYVRWSTLILANRSQNRFSAQKPLPHFQSCAVRKNISSELK